MGYGATRGCRGGIDSKKIGIDGCRACGGKIVEPETGIGSLMIRGRYPQHFLFIPAASFLGFFLHAAVRVGVVGGLIGEIHTDQLVHAIIQVDARAAADGEIYKG